MTHFFFGWECVILTLSAPRMARRLILASSWAPFLATAHAKCVDLSHKSCDKFLKTLWLLVFILVPWLILYQPSRLFAIVNALLACYEWPPNSRRRQLEFQPISLETLEYAFNNNRLTLHKQPEICIQSSPVAGGQTFWRTVNPTITTIMNNHDG